MGLGTTPYTFGAFTFDGIVHTPPTETFTGRIALSVGGKTIDLIASLEAPTVVPGHGPITNAAGVAAVRDF